MGLNRFFSRLFGRVVQPTAQNTAKIQSAESVLPLVLFDLDDTIIDGDSASLWTKFMLQRGLVDNGFIAEEQAMMAQYTDGNMSMEEYMHFTLAPLRTMNEQEVAHQTTLFVHSEIKNRIYPQALKAIRHYQTVGCRLIIISATADFIVQAVAQTLNISEVIAIQTELKDGHYTGKTYGILSYQQGKVQRLKAHLGGQYEKLIKQAIFYSDSCNDLSLLNEVGHPIVVNPDSVLQQHATKCGWLIENWKYEHIYGE